MENAESILTSNGFVKKNRDDFKNNMIEYAKKEFRYKQLFNGFENLDEYVKEFVTLVNKRYYIISDGGFESAIWGWND